MTKALDYERPVLLDRGRHRHRRIRASNGFGFARQANSVVVTGVEFAEACKEFPIVFARQAGGQVAPVAVLGLRQRENLFVDAQDRWTAAYLPAFVRRYPFVLADLGADRLGVCIDEAFAGVNDDEGEALFDAKGNDTPFLQNAIEFLQRFQHEHQRTRGLCRKLQALGLLTEMQARTDLADGRRLTVAGLLVVDEKKLGELPDPAVLDLFRTGELHLVSMHLLSLSNLNRLADRTAERDRTSPPPAPSPPR